MRKFGIFLVGALALGLLYGIAADKARSAKVLPRAADAQNFLRVTPLFATVEDDVRVEFDLNGPDSCYRQSEVETKAFANRIVHGYRIWREGEACREYVVDGGFSTSVSPDKPDIYQGTVRVNEQRVAEYSLRVYPDRAAAQAALSEAIASLSRWELTQAAAQLTAHPNRPAEERLLAALQETIATRCPEPLWWAAMAWLEKTPYLEIVEAARPALRQVPDNWPITERILARVGVMSDPKSQVKAAPACS